MRCLKVLLFVVLVANCQEERLKICNILGKYNECQQLERIGIKCVRAFHGADCMLAVERGEADVGRISAEEALVGIKGVANLSVIGEIRDARTLSQNVSQHVRDSQYQIVVLVRKDITDGFKGLKGKKYCHPGFNYEDTIVSNYVLTEFERSVLKENALTDKVCSKSSLPSTTTAENYVKALAEFFGPSCRPIDTNDEEIDKELNGRYPSLGNCNSNSGFDGALKCLANGADVAVTTLFSVNEFFSKPEYQNEKQNYRFLCPENRMNTMDLPCFWTKQPWDLIIATTSKAEAVTKILQTELESFILAPGPTPYEAKTLRPNDLAEVLLPDKKIKINVLSNGLNLSQYMNGFRKTPDASNLNICGRTMSWCTISHAERQKCLWLRQASINQGITPVIECIQKPNKLICLDELQKQNADVVNIDDFAYIAMRKHLEVISYAASKTNTHPSSILLVKDSIKSFEDLKDKSGCFPEYGGNEWLAFVNTITKKNKNCDYGQFISNYLGDSCMPGAIDNYHEVTAAKEKMCALCKSSHASRTATNCDSSYMNEFYKNGTLNCLKIADFAVINQNDFTDTKGESYAVLCKDGTFKNFSGERLDESCALATTAQSQVVVRRDNEYIKDFSLVFKSFDTLFVSKTPFEILNVFNMTKDLLFKDTTIGFISSKSDERYVQNSRDLLSNIEDCAKQGAASVYLSMTLFMLVTFLQMYIF